MGWEEGKEERKGREGEDKAGRGSGEGLSERRERVKNGVRSRDRGREIEVDIVRERKSEERLITRRKMYYGRTINHWHPP